MPRPAISRSPLTSAAPSDEEVVLVASALLDEIDARDLLVGSAVTEEEEETACWSWMGRLP